MNKDLNSLGLDKKPSDTTVVVAMSGWSRLINCCRNYEKGWLQSNWNNFETL